MVRKIAVAFILLNVAFIGFNYREHWLPPFSSKGAASATPMVENSEAQGPSATHESNQSNASPDVYADLKYRLKVIREIQKAH